MTLYRGLDSDHKIDFMGLCDELLNDSRIHSFHESIQKCKKEWIENRCIMPELPIVGPFMTKLDYLEPEFVSLYEKIYKIEMLHEMKAKDKVWYKYAF